MTGGMSGGHFVGFFLALLGFAVITVVSTRPVVIRRLGTKRWPAVAFSVVVFLLVAIFGSGTREVYFRTIVGPKDEVLARITQAHVDEAWREISRPEFIQYVLRLENAPPLAGSARIAEALSVRVGTTVDVLQEGYQFDPPPQIGQTWLFVSYLDRENALLAILRGDASVRRFELAEQLARRVLPQAAAIVALRTALSDAEKTEILRAHPFVMPYAAEWLHAELGKLIPGASPEFSLQLAQKRAYIWQYVEKPALRDLHGGGRIEPP